MHIDPTLAELLDLPDEQRKIGPFLLVQSLGGDTLAPVWRAQQMYEGEHVRDAVVKLFATRGSTSAAPDFAEKMRRHIVKEVKALCAVKHPNVVQLYELVSDEARGVLGVAMEWVEGTSLEERLAAGPLPLSAALEAGIAVASALAAVHKAGLVHRDVKPANVVESSGVQKLIDFGVAAPEQLHPPAPGGRRPLVVLDDLPLSALGTKMAELEIGGDRPFSGLSGTVGYLDPICVAQIVDETAESDLYALGATLFRCLTGKVPAAAGGEVLKGAVLEGAAPSPSLATLMPSAPAALVALVDKLLDPKRENRPASAREVEDALKKIQADAAAPRAPEARPSPSAAPAPAPAAAAAAAPAPAAARPIQLPPQRPPRTIHAKWVVAGTVALLAGGGYLYSYLSERQVDAEIRDNWSQVSLCLMGDPIKPGETPSLRVRNIQLAAEGAPPSKDPKEWGGEWPSRCAAYARNLRARLEKADRADKYTHDFAWHLEPLAQSMETKKPSPAIVDATWAEAAKKGLVAGAAADVPPPPTPARPLTIDSFKDVAPLAGPKDERVELNPTAAGSVVSLFVHGATPKLCSITDTTARCAPLPDPIKTVPSLRFFGDIEEGGDQLFAYDINEQDKIAQRVYRASGELVAEVRQLEGAVSRADGTVTIAATDSDGKSIVVTQKRGEQASRAKAKWSYGTMYRWGLAFSRERPKGEDEIHFYSSVDNEERVELPKGMTDPSYLCRTAKGVVAYGGTVMAAWHNGHWSSPVEPKLGRGDLSCSEAPAGPTGVFTRIADDKVVEERCSPAGCERVEVELKSLGPERDVSIGTFGGRTVIVWSAGGGGVKLRIAPLKELPSAPTSVVFDGAIKDGAIDGRDTLSIVRLFARDRFAVLFLGTTAGSYALRIAANGTVTPIKLD